MRLCVESGEAYPALFIRVPQDDYDQSRAFEIPDELGQAVVEAQRKLNEAEQALLRHLLDAGLVPRTADIIDDHLDEGAAA